MGVRFPSVSSNTLINGVIVTTAETVIVTSPPFSPPIDFSQIIVLARCSLSPGTASTNMRLGIRRGTTAAGTLIQAQADEVPCAAGAQNGYATFAFDNPGAVGGQQYSLTATMFGATANSTVQDGMILVFAL